MTRTPAPLEMDIALPALPDLTVEAAADAQGVEQLIAQAFGPGRYVKTAERLRETNEVLPELCLVARHNGQVIGCVRQWPIHIGGRPAVFLGPFAVAPEWRSRGLGAHLIENAIVAARSGGHSLILLVGDAPYFKPLGFQPAPDARLPGPVDQGRVQFIALDSGVKAPAGDVTL